MEGRERIKRGRLVGVNRRRRVNRSALFFNVINEIEVGGVRNKGFE